ncbi:MAG: LLM class flavin-dependent oxidoreductase [Thaumarchaeota archaeon]|nr:LLM class flavin-dependent oxidoreductase [Nitrososphaerota archaeon]
MSLARFGINLPVSGRSYAGQHNSDFQGIKEIAQIADRHGYASIGVHDHLLNPQGSAPGGREKPDRFADGVLEGWTTLSAVATVTERARLTNVVLCNLFRNPAVLAKMASTLDTISNGRVTLALGAGWFKTECLAYGIQWEPYGRRLGMLRESVRLIKRLWKEGEVTFKGEYYRLEKGILSPKPVQKPRPPIVVGGSSENIMRLAVEEADGWDVDTGASSFEVFQERLSAMEKYCLEVGRDMKSIRITVNVTPFMAGSVADARKIASGWAAYIGKNPEDYVSSRAVWLGTAEDMLAAAEPWFASGVSQINLLMPNDPSYVRMFTGGMEAAI